METKKSEFETVLLPFYNKNKVHHKIMRNNKKIISSHKLCAPFFQGNPNENFEIVIKEDSLEDFKIVFNSLLDLIKENYFNYIKVIALYEIKVYNTKLSIKEKLDDYSEAINYLLSDFNDEIFNSKRFIKIKNGKSVLDLHSLSKGSKEINNYFFEKLKGFDKFKLNQEVISSLCEMEIIMKHSFEALTIVSFGYKCPVRELNQPAEYLKKIYNTHVDFLKNTPSVEHESVINKIKKLEKKFNIDISLHLNPSQSLEERDLRNINIEMKPINLMDFKSLLNVIEKQLFVASLEHDNQNIKVPLYSMGYFATHSLAMYSQTSLYKNNNSHFGISSVTKDDIDKFEGNAFLSHEIQHYKSSMVLNNIYYYEKSGFWKTSTNRVSAASYFLFEKIWEKRKNSFHTEEVRKFPELNNYLENFSKLMSLYIFGEINFDFNKLSMSEKYYSIKKETDLIIAERMRDLLFDSLKNDYNNNDYLLLRNILDENKSLVTDFLFKNLQNNIIDAYVLKNIHNEDKLNFQDANFYGYKNSFLNIDLDIVRDIVFTDLIDIASDCYELIMSIQKQKIANIEANGKLSEDKLDDFMRNNIGKILDNKTKSKLRRLKNKIEADEIPKVFYNAYLNNDILREGINDKYFTNSMKYMLYTKNIRNINGNNNYYFYLTETDEICSRNTETYNIKKIEKIKKNFKCDIQKEGLKHTFKNSLRVLSKVKKNVDLYSKENILKIKIKNINDFNAVSYKLSNEALEEITDSMLAEQISIQKEINKNIIDFKSVSPERIKSFLEDFKHKSLLDKYVLLIDSKNKKTKKLK